MNPTTNEEQVYEELKSMILRGEQPEGEFLKQRELAAQFGYEAKKKGVVVTAVAPGSPASTAGIRTGDLITELNRQEVKSISDYEKAMAGIKAGDTILVLIDRRGGRVREHRRADLHGRIDGGDCGVEIAHLAGDLIRRPGGEIR